MNDPDTAEKLLPHHIIGCKRLSLGTGYYATYNRANVSLVQLGEGGVEWITAEGMVTGGTEYRLDDLVLATGFDAMTGTLSRIDIRGRDGVTLKQAWEAGPRNYLGLMINGFPNLFTDHRARQPIRVVQYDADHRASRGMDRRLPWLFAQPENS